jgi:NADH-quinone oxidoreductase subunit E
MSVRRLFPVQPESFDFTPENLAWAKNLLKNYPERKQASAVIPILWRAQEQNGGWVTRAAIEYVAKLLEMSFIRVYEIATFYTMFQLAPVGRKAHVQVCGTTPCMLRGAEDLINLCRRRISSEPHGLSADGNFSWEEVECLGACVNAPMVQIWKDTYEDLTPEILERILDDLATGKKVKPGPQNGRQMSAPLGELTSLTDPILYSGERRFERIEMPPPAKAAPAPAPVSAAPAPASKPEGEKSKEASPVAKAPRRAAPKKQPPKKDPL